MLGLGEAGGRLAADLVAAGSLPCGQSVQTVNRSELAPWCGFGYSVAHARFYWGMKLVVNA